MIREGDLAPRSPRAGCSQLGELYLLKLEKVFGRDPVAIRNPATGIFPWMRSWASACEFPARGLQQFQALLREEKQLPGHPTF